MKAVIDRFEGDYAVLLVGKDETMVNLPKNLLPEGAREGSWLSITLLLDPEETSSREKRIAEKLQRLKDKGKS